MPSAKSLLLAAAASPSLVGAAHWAVIVAGSNGFSNYRHQADACHAYQLMRAKGIPEDNIITMMYDDVANHPENPIPGKLFNAPDPNGNGVDVYEGCKIDYRKDQVTVDNYISVLTGNGTGKVLKSTKDDYVFMYFVDHGAPGLIAFPETVMHKTQLQGAFKTMHDKGMYKQLTYYLETCESGSMFEGMDVPGVYAVSAASPNEPSWGTFCGEESKVGNTTLNTCLADLFSANWIHDAERATAGPASKESLQDQFNNVQTLTNKSHVTQWGDKSFTTEPAADFFGNQGENSLLLAALVKGSRTPSGSVDSRGADLHRLYTKYQTTESWLERAAAAKQLQFQTKLQYGAEAVHWKLASIAYPGDEKAQKGARKLRHKPMYADCELAGHEAIRQGCKDQFDANTGFALQFHQVVVNICHDIAELGLNLDISAAAMQACGKTPTVVV